MDFLGMLFPFVDRHERWRFALRKYGTCELVQSIAHIVEQVLDLIGIDRRIQVGNQTFPELAEFVERVLDWFGFQGGGNTFDELARYGVDVLDELTGHRVDILDDLLDGSELMVVVTPSRSCPVAELTELIIP